MASFDPLIILGSTGSIGTQALAVCQQLKIPVVGLACQKQGALLAQQIQQFHPQAVCLMDPQSAQDLAQTLKTPEWLEAFRKTDPALWYQTGCPEILVGQQGLLELVNLNAKRVLAAMVGFAGLMPVMRAIETGKSIALANKETLVTAGAFVLQKARECQVAIYPVDSEHAAIWQCLRGGDPRDLRRIFLTASGGPFREYPKTTFRQFHAAQALKHPTWSMGAKITLDSATLMNKGLEVIEAAHLFGCSVDQIEVVVHPQSIIHSMIEWKNGSVLAQLGFPDMRLPIQEGLTYPQMAGPCIQRFNPFDEKARELTFEAPRTKDFPLLGLAYEAFRLGGYAPTYLNAANEVAVHYCLQGDLTIGQLMDLVERSFNQCLSRSDGTWSVDGIMEADAFARRLTQEEVKRCQSSSAWGLD